LRVVSLLFVMGEDTDFTPTAKQAES
jgi:hypothetical protein